MKEIYDLIKDINKKTVTLASGEKGKISRIMRFDSGEVLVELKAPNGEISLEGFYPFALSVENEHIYQECQQIDYYLNKLTTYKNITIMGE